MAARLGLLGPEGGAEGIDLAEGHGGGLVVELAGLRQVDLLLVEVVDLEQRGGSFAGGRREDGRVEQRESVGVEIVANGPDHLVANAQDGVLPPAAQPQVPVIHQEIDAVLFGRDRIRDRTPAPAGRSRGSPRPARSRPGARGSARILPVTMMEDSCVRSLIASNRALRQLALDGHALQDAGAVAQDGEGDLARSPQVIEPPGDDHGLASVLAGLVNRDPARRPRSGSSKALQFLEDPAHVLQRLGRPRILAQFQAAGVLIGARTQQFHRLAASRSSRPPTGRGTGESRSGPSLSWMCVDRMRSFMISKAAGTPSFMCAWPTSKHSTPGRGGSRSGTSSAAPRWRSGWGCSPGGPRRLAAARTRSAPRAR